MYRNFGKRALDLILSELGLVILLPIIVIIYFLVIIKLGKPAIFKQKRPGKNEKIFTLYKFRTMTNQKDKSGNLLKDEQRLTKFGKFLRSTSLDELPELINIIKGDMSIVGPRPQLVKDMVFMNEEQRKRHKVRQGLTGLAQINGRNNITWEQKISYDLEYINNISFKNDCNIVLKTIGKVFKRENIETDGMQTAEDLGDYLLRNKLINEDEYFTKIEEANQILERGRK